MGMSWAYLQIKSEEKAGPKDPAFNIWFREQISSHLNEFADYNYFYSGRLIPIKARVSSPL